MSKWTVDGIGPRKIKPFKEALSALAREVHTWTERDGVHGGESRDSTFWSPFGPARNEVAAAKMGEVGERHGWVVTGENLDVAVSDLNEAREEARLARPVVDKRRTQEEQAGIDAAMAKARAEAQAVAAKAEAAKSAVLAAMPPWAAAAIVATLDVDKSDSMSDYFAHETSRTVVIGWRRGAREDFGQLRAAAARFPETAHLGPDAPKDVEHRDNYSMGRGNYLKAGHTHSTGWAVQSRDPKHLYGEVEVAECAKSATAPAPAPKPVLHNLLPDDMLPALPAVDCGFCGATVAPSAVKAGNVEIKFPSKPSAEVRDLLKGAGFRWWGPTGVWYGRKEKLPAQFKGGTEVA